METGDRYILLKIKREWSKDESVQALLKMISELNVQIGILKSDLSEINDKHALEIKGWKLKVIKANQISAASVEEKAAKKGQILPDKIYKALANELETYKKLYLENRKQLNEYIDKYYNLLNKQQPEKNAIN